ncbi:DUF3180 domain-containing protein [Rothia nasimurium]|uniref:DUF3180 domain-containing protein n=1 Tax=Rothia nasimurium TaxID=85336 RepID=UPI001F195110|nr:DUF3180 domain-containing protein [Rothia nasimurium]
MKLRSRALALLAGVGVASGAVLNLLSVQSGGPELSLPALTLLAALILAGLALYFARQVYRYSRVETRKNAGSMNPLMAARVAVFAQALALTGALVGGWQVAILVYQLGLLTSRALAQPLVESSVALVGGLVMLVAGIVAENWCKIPPGDQDAGGGVGEVSPQTGPLARNKPDSSS